jgi:hypothetical protein
MATAGRRVNLTELPDRLIDAERLLDDAEPKIGQAMGPDLLALHQAQLLMARAQLALLRALHEQWTFPPRLVGGDVRPTAEPDTWRCTILRFDHASPPYGPRCRRPKHDDDRHEYGDPTEEGL